MNCTGKIMDNDKKRNEFADKLAEMLTHRDLCRAFFGGSPMPVAWQIKYGCEIIPNYIPPFAKDTQPSVVVKCGEWFLRYSKGPVQGFFWDLYGDDMLTVGFAFRAMIEAPPPPDKMK